MDKIKITIQNHYELNSSNDDTNDVLEGKYIKEKKVSWAEVNKNMPE